MKLKFNKHQHFNGAVTRYEKEQMKSKKEWSLWKDERETLGVLVEESHCLRPGAKLHEIIYKQYWI